MDSITIEKHQAMNKYQKNQFLNNFILHSFTVVTFILLCYSLYWVPSLCSSIKIFFFVSLPKIGSHFINPKCLFIVCNIIIVFLIGESKLAGSKSSSTEIYEEYVKSSGSLQRLQNVEEKKEELCLVEESEKKMEVKEELETKEEKEKEVKEEEKEGEEVKEEEEEEEEGEEEKEEKEYKENQEDLEGEEELGLPAEELNKRVEDFIARMNTQRRLEARLLVCSSE